jgi:general secretion pathway protein H
MRTSVTGTTKELRASAHRGFTLIEVVVVLFVLTIVLGFVGVRLTRDEGDLLRDEGRRLALVLQNAQQQAILEGRPYAFALTPEGYRFLGLDRENHLVPIEFDELLGPRVLPRVMTLGPVKPRGDKSTKADPIVFDPSGEFPSFTLVLTIGEAVWYVQGSNDGRIRSAPALEQAPA